MSQDAWVVVVGNFATGVEAIVGPFFSLKSLRYPQFKQVMVVKVHVDDDEHESWSDESHVALTLRRDLRIDEVVFMGDHVPHERRWVDSLYPVISPEKYFG